MEPLDFVASPDESVSISDAANVVIEAEKIIDRPPLLAINFNLLHFPSFRRRPLHCVWA